MSICEKVPKHQWPAKSSSSPGTLMGTYDNDPDHPILNDPYSWELLEFTYRRDPTDGVHSHIDMVFLRGGETCRLRFYNPQQIEMSAGVPNSFGMCILDVSQRQLQGIGVRVANFEESNGAPTFWAERVVNLDDPNRQEKDSLG
jgi:hypothetical protein